MKPFYSVFILVALVSCKEKVPAQQEDELYSRHLQRCVKLSIINTPIPDDKSTLNLLLLNDGQDAKAMRVKDIVDSLYNAGLIKPLLVVAIHAGDRMQEYGISGKPDYEKRGSKADHYNSFIDKELYAFIKKKAGVRKFNSIAIAGWSLGGLSAFDVAWNNTDKIDKAGLFSPSFWWRDLNTSDTSYSDAKNRIAIQVVKASRRKASQLYWFYAGEQEENSDRDKDGISDVVDDLQDTREALINKGLARNDNTPFVLDKTGKHDISSWSKNFPAFLLWAFAK